MKRVSKDPWDLNMVLLCGSKNIAFLQEVLKSIYTNFSRTPNIFVITDNSTNVRFCKEKIKWFPKDRLTLITANDCLDYHKAKGRNSLFNFASRNPMGLKLAAILQIAEIGKPLLYSDTDVLWLQDPFELIQQLINSVGANINLSFDFQPAYDEQLVSMARLESLLNKAPYYCAGIMLIKNFSSENIQLIERLLPFLEKQSNHFSEQTIFATLQKSVGPSRLEQEKFSIILDDQFDLRPLNRPKLIARHYIGPVRHLFWRDAFFMVKK